MKKTELRNFIENTDRYKSFTLLDEPKPFNEIFKDKDFDHVQTHSTQMFEIPGEGKDIIGFSGVFAWKNNQLTSLDHDTYSESMPILGYDYFSNEKFNVHNGLEILVGENW